MGMELVHSRYLRNAVLATAIVMDILGVGAAGAQQLWSVENVRKRSVSSSVSTSAVVRATPEGLRLETVSVRAVREGVESSL